MDFIEMEGMVIPGAGSIWSYQESFEDLKRSLLCTTMELESTRIFAIEERKRSQEQVNQLHELLEITCRERDEARDQLQRLLKKFIQTNPKEASASLPNLQPDTPPTQQTKFNSSFTESQSYVSSPVDSIFETVSSLDLSNMNMEDSSNIGALNQPFLHNYDGSSPTGQFDHDLTKNASKNSRMIAAIDEHFKIKALPEKGKLLQAVMEAGPLLQNLLVSGPLPQWRNPPPLVPLQIPPISVKSPKSLAPTQNPIIDAISQFQNSPSLSYNESFHDGYPTNLNSLLHCSKLNNPCLKKRPAIHNSVGGHFAKGQSSTGKQQKLH